ncbi:MAG: diacylglycerol kinase family lipid kinase [Porphyromonas sp.]|nr:diacylglycerol kinase family lipid kinase [Porphyromonas sp.]
MKILAIINPIAGVGEKSQIPSRLAKALQKTEHFLAITYTKENGHATELASKAVEMGFDAVIAVGGDGTVNEIATALRHTNVILGIIPRGSGNGLARALNIPMTVSGAIDRIVRGKIRCIDCCMANDHAFFCTCGMGFDAKVSEAFANASRRGPLQYMITTVSEFLTYTPQNYQLTIDGHGFAQKAFVLTVANAPQYGNNAYIAPGASLEDGLMDVILIGPVSQVEGPVLALQLFTKNIGQNKHLDRYSARELLVEREDVGVVHLDGEPVEMGREIRVIIQPAAVRVFV